MIRGHRHRGLHAGSVSSTALVLLVLLAGLLAAFVLLLDRQASRTSREQAAQQMQTAAQLAASEVRTEAANLRTVGARLAAATAFRQAVASDDEATLLAIARASHAKIDIRGRQVGELARPPRLAATIVFDAHGSTVATVTLGLPLDRRLLARVRSRVPLPEAARLSFAAGSAAHSPASRVAASAAVGAGEQVVAEEPLAVVDARTSAYLHKLVFAAILTFLLGILVARGLARPLRALVGDLSSRAERDALTGLPNRRMLDERLHEEFERALRHGTELSLVLLDVDDFKQINDRYGHQCGDEVLRAVAQVLAASVRSSDLAGRFGGEEFAVVLSGTGAPGAARVAEQIRSGLENLDVAALPGERVRVTASFGVSALSDARSVAQLVERADRRLYAAKRAGKNRVVMAERAGSAEELTLV
jgi:diguanylate cyclase (GGDEF)-like protein